MKIELKGLAGYGHGKKKFRPGKIYDVEDEFALKLIAADKHFHRAVVASGPSSTEKERAKAILNRLAADPSGMDAIEKFMAAAETIGVATPADEPEKAETASDEAVPAVDPEPEVKSKPAKKKAAAKKKTKPAAKKPAARKPTTPKSLADLNK
jgi:hypothetical protein